MIDRYNGVSVHDRTYRVEVQLDKTSKPIVYKATDTYEKGGFFCVRFGDTVHKYPINNIWRVKEEY